jgi:hypothetical protein
MIHSNILQLLHKNEDAILIEIPQTWHNH